MKKTIKVLGLLLVAAAMFTGCDFGKAEEKAEGDLCEPLFDLSETKLTTVSIELSDGDWTYREYDKSNDSVISFNFYFSVKNGKVDLKKDFHCVEQRLYSEASTYIVDSLISGGYEGDELFWYREADKADIQKYMNKDVDKLDEFEYKAARLVERFSRDDDTTGLIADLFTNKDKTKYAWSIYKNTGGNFHYMYLAKD